MVRSLRGIWRNEDLCGGVFAKRPHRKVGFDCLMFGYAGFSVLDSNVLFSPFSRCSKMAFSILAGSLLFKHSRICRCSLHTSRMMGMLSLVKFYAWYRMRSERLLIFWIVSVIRSLSIYLKNSLWMF